MSMVFDKERENKYGSSNIVNVTSILGKTVHDQDIYK